MLQAEHTVSQQSATCQTAVHALQDAKFQILMLQEKVKEKNNQLCLLSMSLESVKAQSSSLVQDDSHTQNFVFGGKDTQQLENEFGNAEDTYINSFVTVDGLQWNSTDQLSAHISVVKQKEVSEGSGVISEIGQDAFGDQLDKWAVKLDFPKKHVSHDNVVVQGHLCTHVVDANVSMLFHYPQTPVQESSTTQLECLEHFGLEHNGCFQQVTLENNLDTSVKYVTECSLGEASTITWAKSSQTPSQTEQDMSVVTLEKVNSLENPLAEESTRYNSQLMKVHNHICKFKSFVEKESFSEKHEHSFSEKVFADNSIFLDDLLHQIDLLFNLNKDVLHFCPKTLHPNQLLQCKNAMATKTVSDYDKNVYQSTDNNYLELNDSPDTSSIANLPASAEIDLLKNCLQAAQAEKNVLLSKVESQEQQTIDCDVLQRKTESQAYALSVELSECKKALKESELANIGMQEMIDCNCIEMESLQLQLSESNKIMELLQNTLSEKDDPFSGIQTKSQQCLDEDYIVGSKQQEQCDIENEHAVNHDFQGQLQVKDFKIGIILDEKKRLNTEFNSLLSVSSIENRSLRRDTEEQDHKMKLLMDEKDNLDANIYSIKSNFNKMHNLQQLLGDKVKTILVRSNELAELGSIAKCRSEKIKCLQSHLLGVREKLFEAEQIGKKMSEESNKEMGRLLSVVHDLENKVSEAHKENVELKLRMNTEEEEHRLREDDLVSEKMTLSNQLKDAKDELLIIDNNLKYECNSLKHEIKSKKKSEGMLRSEMDLLREEYRKSMNAMQSLNKINYELCNEKKIMEDTISNFKYDSISIQKEFEAKTGNLQNKNDSLILKHSVNSKELERERMQLKEMNKNVHEQVHALLNQVDNLNEKLTQSECLRGSAINLHDDDNRVLSMQLDESQSQLHATNIELESVKKQLRDMSDLMENKTACLNEELNMLLVKVDCKEKVLHDVEQELAKARDELLVSQKDKRVLKNNYDSCLGDMSQKVADSDGVIQELQAKLLEISYNHSNEHRKMKDLYDKKVSELTETHDASDRKIYTVNKSMECILDEKNRISDLYTETLTQLEHATHELELKSSEFLVEKSDLMQSHNKEIEESKNVYKLQLFTLNENYQSLENIYGNQQNLITDICNKHVQDKKDAEKAFEVQIAESHEAAHMKDLDISWLKNQMIEMKNDHEKELLEEQDMHERHAADLERKCTLALSELGHIHQSMWMEPAIMLQGCTDLFSSKDDALTMPRNVLTASDDLVHSVSLQDQCVDSSKFVNLQCQVESLLSVQNATETCLKMLNDASLSRAHITSEVQRMCYTLGKRSCNLLHENISIGQNLKMTTDDNGSEFNLMQGCDEVSMFASNAPTNQAKQMTDEALNRYLISSHNFPYDIYQQNSDCVTKNESSQNECESMLWSSSYAHATTCRGHLSESMDETDLAENSMVVGLPQYKTDIVPALIGYQPDNHFHTVHDKTEASAFDVGEECSYMPTYNLDCLQSSTLTYSNNSMPTFVCGSVCRRAEKADAYVQTQLVDTSVCSVEGTSLDLYHRSQLNKQVAIFNQNVSDSFPISCIMTEGKHSADEWSAHFQLHDAYLQLFYEAQLEILKTLCVQESQRDSQPTDSDTVAAVLKTVLNTMQKHQKLIALEQRILSKLYFVRDLGKWFDYDATSGVINRQLFQETQVGQN